MTEQLLSIQPFPFCYKGAMHPGSLYSWPIRCLSCKRAECSHFVNDTMHNCSKGVAFCYVTPDILLGGIVALQGPMSHGQKKALRECKKIQYDIFDKTIKKLRRLLESPPPPKPQQPSKVSPPSTKNNEIGSTILALHEFKSILATILKNINVIVETNTPGNGPLEQKLEQSKNLNEKAIYYASRMLEGKLHSFEFIQDKNKIADKSLYAVFRFHGLLHKYVQIYKSQFSVKKIHLCHKHNSTIELFTNPDAIAVIIQNFIDNAFKYAPPATEIEISSFDSDKEIIFSITSIGPEITDKNKIFERDYREETARKVTKDGLGFGLYISKTIADALRLRLTVEQVSTQETAWFTTTFKLAIPFHLFAANRIE